MSVIDRPIVPTSQAIEERQRFVFYGAAGLTRDGLEWMKSLRVRLRQTIAPKQS